MLISNKIITMVMKELISSCSLMHLRDTYNYYVKVSFILNMIQRIHHLKKTGLQIRKTYRKNILF